MPRLTTQAEISNPQRKGYDFRIDNQLYRAAISGERQMTIQSSDVNEQGVNVKQNPEDFTSNLGRIFSRKVIMYNYYRQQKINKHYLLL